MAGSWRISLGLTLALFCSDEAKAADGDVSDGPSVAARFGEPIIVTARRREEAIERVPMSVIALPRDELENRNVSGLADLQRLVPNLTLAPAQNLGDAAGNIFIRGIGQEDFAAGVDPGVGLYLDGVYIGRTMGALGDLLDIERVEVLRGPQGTLYGRNTIGGAINLVTRPPADTSRLQMRLSGGSNALRRVAFVGEGPIAPNLLIRAAMSASQRGGYVRRLPLAAPSPFIETDRRAEGESQQFAARLALRLQVNDELTADLAFDTSQRRGAQSATHLDAVDPTVRSLPAVNRLIREGILPGPPIDDRLVSTDLLQSYAGSGNRISQDVDGATLTIVQSFEAHDVRLTAAYRHLGSYVDVDVDGTPFVLSGSTFDERHDQYSAELQASGRIGAIEYSSGLTAYHEAADLFPVAAAGVDILYLCRCFYSPATLPRVTFPQRGYAGTAFGAYLQTSIPLAPRVRLTLGARYSYDRKRVTAALVLLDPTTLEPTDSIVAKGANRDSWNAVTWRTGIEYQMDDDLMFYLSAARGFKSGGFNVRPSQILPNLGLTSFAPEFATTYESGVRATLPGGKLRASVTLFHSEYRDIQLRQQTFVGQILTTLVENAARARVRGVEVELVAIPTDGVTLGLAYGHIAPRFLNIGAVPNLTLSSAFQRTARHTLSLSLDAERRLGPGRLGLHADYSYRSHEQFQISPTPWDQTGYGLLNGRLTWAPLRGGWSLAVFGSNLANIRYRSAGRGTLLRDTGFAHSIVGRPREIGVELKLSY